MQTEPKTNNDLLIRIDERVKKTSEDIVDIKSKLDCKVDNNKTYEEMTDKVDDLWDNKNRLVGWMIGAGVAGGGISTVLSGLVKTIFASIK